MSKSTLRFDSIPYRWILTAAIVAGVSIDASAIDITVDYRYDTNNFFDAGDAEGQLARSALEAAANRFSSVISSPLLEAILRDDNDDPRIGFTHPGTGISHQVSAAGSVASDTITTAGGSPANEYTGGLTFGEDEWVLYAGGRPLDSAGLGGTGTGTNFSNIFNETNSHLNRGFRQSGSISNLPVWGGAISFDNSGALDWHFDHAAAAPTGTLDFYSIALHEIGHALGLASSWQEWDENTQGITYVGTEAVAAHNQDNDLQINALNLLSNANRHWEDGTYESFIFASGTPNLAGTVGLDERQDLLMEPIANFNSNVRRFELTNIDVGALKDIGWTIDDTPVLACDLNSDQECDVQDLDVLILSIQDGLATLDDRDTWLSDAAEQQGKPAPFLLGDVDLDGIVDAADLNTIGQYWNLPSGRWSLGDFDASGETNASDLNALGINWRKSNDAAALAAVPEPRISTMLLFITSSLLTLKRRTLAER